MKNIVTIKDAKNWVRALIARNIYPNPDDDFTTYVSVKNNELSFSETEATELNAQLDQIWSICESHGKDIHDLFMSIVKKESALSVLFQK